MPKLKIPKISLSMPTTLVAKISLGFTAIGLLFLLNLGNTVKDAYTTSASLNRMVDESIPIFTHMSDISSSAAQLEPFILELLETTTIDQVDRIGEKINTEFNALQTLLSEVDNKVLSEPLASAVENGIDDLIVSANEVAFNIQAITEQQANVINIQEQLKLDIALLDEQKDILDPLLSDILYELDDDYVISIIQEFRASASDGMLIIEKLKNVSSEEELDVLVENIDRWARDHKSVLQALPLSAGEDPIAYIQLIKALNETTDSILILTQGEFTGYDYENGLQESKAKQVSIIASQRELLNSFRLSLNQLLAQASTLVETGFDDLNSSSNQIQNNLISQRSVGYISGAVALILILMISVYLTRFFKKAIATVQHDLTQLAHGELAKSTPQNGHDEFSKINASVGIVSDSLRDIVIGIGDANTKINDGVERVTSQSTDTLNFVAGQKEELEMVAAALTEMTATANEVASHASSTHEKVTNASELSRSGRENVAISKDMIDQVSQQSSEAKTVIDSLNKGVQGIEAILANIASISDQTNLLALNAAIEAARAGEHGRGFAVVADEVRALAGRTQTSTNEIQEMTVNMLKESARAVEVMEQSGELVGRSVTSAQLADETIAQFATLMEEVLDLSRLIATASEEQASTVNELSTNVHQVSDLAERTHKSAESSQTTSAELRDLATELQAKVSRFHLLP